MAQFAVHGTWRSVIALTFLLAFAGLLTFAVAGGLHDASKTARVYFGLILYLLAFFAIGFGFWSKEDTVAVGGIIGVSLLMILDILLRVGILSYNGIQVLH